MSKQIDMNRLIRKEGLHTTGSALAAGVAALAAATAIALSAPAFAAAKDYRFEVVQIASAGPGKSDVTVRLVRTADGKPVAAAVISANGAIGTQVEQPGYRRFRVETTKPGPQTLQVFAKVPGPTRVERTFNTSIKAMLERTVRGRDELVTSTIAFDPQ